MILPVIHRFFLCLPTYHCFFISSRTSSSPLCPGLGSVSRATVKQLSLPVLEEPVLKLKIVTMLTKVIFLLFISTTMMIDVLHSRNPDHRVQPGRDLHPLHPGELPSPRHPWETQSLAHSDRECSLWWSVLQHLHRLPGAPTERRWLDTIFLDTHRVQNGSLSVGFS